MFKKLSELIQTNYIKFEYSLTYRYCIAEYKKSKFANIQVCTCDHSMLLNSKFQLLFSHSLML